MVVDAARRAGESAYIGDGSNRWPAVHRFDAARVFRLALESAAAGSVLHAVGEEGVPTREIAEAIGRGLGVPVASIARQDADERFGFLATFLSLDVPASSALTQAQLGWRPEQPGLLEDLGAEHYFAAVPV
jgi:nucleoside-diphosphate-sugar epimerase